MIVVKTPLKTGFTVSIVLPSLSVAHMKPIEYESHAIVHSLLTCVLNDLQ